MKTIINRILQILLIILSLAVVSVGSVNAYMIISTKDSIYTTDEFLDKVRIGDGHTAAVILGAGIRGDKPSSMLAERLDTGIDLYNAGVVSKLLMSGDNINPEYNEVRVMMKYAMNHGVPQEDIMVDKSGYRTYASVYRAKDKFGLDKIVLVTQKYHLYRAQYIADALGIQALSVSCDKIRYRGQIARDIREVASRTLAFIECIFKKEPKINPN